MDAVRLLQIIIVLYMLEKDYRKVLVLELNGIYNRLHVERKNSALLCDLVKMSQIVTVLSHFEHTFGTSQ